jgi:hypothetical protein
VADGIASRFNRYTTGPNVGTPTYTGADERLLDAVLVHPAAALLARPGIRPGPGGTISFGGSPEAVTIQPCSGIITDTGAGGSFKWVIPAAVTIPLPTRPATGQTRISDLVGVILNDEVRGADGTREMDVQLLNGAAGASPTAPTLTPAGALRLRRLTIAPTGTPALSMAPQRIAALGGTIPVADQAERDAIEVIYDGLSVYREDLDVFQDRVNGAWATRLNAAPGDATLTDVTTFGTNWSHNSTALTFDKTQVERNAGMVTAYIAAVKSTTAAVNDTVCVLPPGFRPRRKFRASGRVATALQAYSVDVDGTVALGSAAGNGLFDIVTFPGAP